MFAATEMRNSIAHTLTNSVALAFAGYLRDRHYHLPKRLLCLCCVRLLNGFSERYTPAQKSYMEHSAASNNMTVCKVVHCGLVIMRASQLMHIAKIEIIVPGESLHVLLSEYSKAISVCICLFIKFRFFLFTGLYTNTDKQVKLFMHFQKLYFKHIDIDSDIFPKSRTIKKQYKKNKQKKFAEICATA